MSESGAGNYTPWRTFKHFDYSFLYNVFHKVFLQQLSKQLGTDFNKSKNFIYKKHKDTFYV
ncbi:MAG: hypothetical protein LBQ71_15425 [Hungatella sp.]|nr:hypothetical protein [Hungatella sp.]